MLPRTEKTVCDCRLQGKVANACVWLLTAVALAWAPAFAIDTARDLVRRGDNLLHQARAEPEDERREQRLSAAVDTFSKAYGLARRQAKIHALIGAAQGYLLMRQAPSRFPFLWSAPPLKRAEKSLQHVLALAPDHAAANLLMGITLWRRAESATSEAELRDRSEYYLRQAVNAGMKVRLPTSEPIPGHFDVDDTIIALQFVDARGTGRIEDMIFVYRKPSEAYCYGMVVSPGIAYPLVSETVSGGVAKATTLTSLDVAPQASDYPWITLTWAAQGRLHRVAFQWNGTTFELVPTTLIAQ